MGRKRGTAVPLLWGGAGSPSNTQCGLGRGLLPYEVVSSSIQSFGDSRHEPKTGGYVPYRGGAATPCNTTLPGWRFTSVPSGILIHPAIWPQKTWAKKWAVLCPFLRGAGSPSKTMSPVLRPTSAPNGILIHPAIWPQQTWNEN